MKMRRILLACVFVAIIAVLSACSQGGNDVTNTYNQALNSMKKGDFAKAADALEGISFYEDSVQLRQYCRAHAYAAERNYEECLSLLSMFFARPSCILIFILISGRNSRQFAAIRGNLPQFAAACRSPRVLRKIFFWLHLGYESVITIPLPHVLGINDTSGSCFLQQDPL